MRRKTEDRLNVRFEQIDMVVGLLWGEFFFAGVGRAGEGWGGLQI